METKLSKLKKSFYAKDYQTALRIASKFFDLGNHRDAIKMAHESFSNERFYKSLKKDINQLRLDGIRALADRYSLDFQE